MTRHRNSHDSWADALPGDWPENEPKVYLYRIDPQRGRQYLGVFPAWYFDESFVQSQFGGGDYWYRAVYKGRICRSDGFLIDGPPKPVPGSPVRESRPVRKQLGRHRR
ncbi:MAG TPA: hypothetical protein DEA71_18260 [Nitrospira sp.]|nr:hypothetical protein [Nitrospira sp.]